MNLVNFCNLATHRSEFRFFVRFCYLDQFCPLDELKYEFENAKWVWTKHLIVFLKLATRICSKYFDTLFNFFSKIELVCLNRSNLNVWFNLNLRAKLEVLSRIWYDMRNQRPKQPLFQCFVWFLIPTHDCLFFKFRTLDRVRSKIWYDIWNQRPRKP